MRLKRIHFFFFLFFKWTTVLNRSTQRSVFFSFFFIFLFRCWINSVQRSARRAFRFELSQFREEDELVEFLEVSEILALSDVREKFRQAFPAQKAFTYSYRSVPLWIVIFWWTRCEINFRRIWEIILALLTWMKNFFQFYYYRFIVKGKFESF